MKIALLAGAVAASAMALAAVPAAAQTFAPTYYGTLGYAFINGDGDVNLGAVTARVGARFHRYFGAEVEGAIGVDSDRSVVSGVTVRTELKHSFAGYGVAYLPLSPKLDLFVRGGYGGSKVRASALGVSLSDSEDSWNYGVGAQYLFDERNGVRADYTRHDFGNGHGTADVWGVSYVRKF